jgi:predicted SnoaL-like aldol condensation-catalyzing enzyme
MNRMIAFVFAFALLIAAAPSAFAQDEVVTNKQLVIDFVTNVLNTGDAAAAGDYVTPEYIQNVPGTPSGIEALQGSIGMMQTAFPDLNYSILQIGVQDDLVAARIFISGTQDGDFMGIPASGNPVAIVSVNFWRVEEGLLAEHWEVQDSLTFMQQLGIAPGGTPADGSLIPDADLVITEVSENDVDAETLATNTATIESFFSDVINAQDLDAVDALMNEDFIWNSPFVAPGREGLKQFYPIIFEAFPDVQRTPDLIVADGDLVFVFNTITGTHEGGEQLYGMPPTGNPIEYTSADIFRLEDSVIVELWDVADYLTLYTQIGLIPAT